MHIWIIYLCLSALDISKDMLWSVSDGIGRKMEEHSTKHSGTSDNTQPADDGSLLSIRTLEPWHIPERCMVSASLTVFTVLSFLLVDIYFFV